MELERIEIKNYKSIKSLVIPLKKINGSSLSILLGLNESGKSNILKAINEMSDKTVLNYEQDCQKDARRSGEQIQISFFYKLGDLEITQLENWLSEKENIKINEGKTFPKEIEKKLILNKNSEKIQKWILQSIDFISPQNENSSKETSEVSGQIKAIKIYSPELNEKINQERTIVDFLNKNESKIIYWKASPEYLISNPINLDKFKQNKDINVPLKNLFNLIGIESSQVDSLIDRAKGDHSERRKVSKDISEKATKYINNIWPEHKISFEVSIESNSNCFVHIMDKDSEELFGMNERSDGFKQFVSILLTLSAEVRSKVLKGNIILIDEPEVNLHPSSIQYLRDELLKISQENCLIVASHSIFMIDKRNLERHIRVFKERDGTKIEEISRDNPFAEEVVYRSLGTSIYEIIEPYILIFEGSVDKEIYDAFTLKFKEEQDISHLKTIAASGVYEIRKYLKFFNQKTVTGIVLVDSDQDGKNVLRAIKENDQEFERSSFEILDILKLEKTKVCLEDLLPLELVKEAFFEVYDSELQDSHGQESILEKIKSFKLSKDITGDHNLTDLKSAISRKVLLDMTFSQEKIKEKYPLYFEFFKKLNEKIRNIQTISR